MLPNLLGKTTNCTNPNLGPRLGSVQFLVFPQLSLLRNICINTSGHKDTYTNVRLQCTNILYLTFTRCTYLHWFYSSLSKKWVFPEKKKNKEDCHMLPSTASKREMFKLSRITDRKFTHSGIPNMDISVLFE